jgi:hypothetical protein
MNKATPGPWEVVEGRSGDSVEVFGEKSICEMWRRKDDSATVKANARLIAAAPCMYELIKNIASCGNMTNSQQDDLIRKAAEIIKRAEGGAENP